MLFALTDTIRTALQAKGVPYSVVYGPERAAASVADTRIVVQRDRSGGSDEIEGPVNPRRNPRQIFTLWQACEALILAQSTEAGPGVHLHERIAEQLRDKLLVALHVAVRKLPGRYKISGCRYLTAAELEEAGLEQWPGVVYLVRFAVDRSVEDSTWTGAKASQATGVGLHTTTKFDESGTTTAGELPGAQVRL